MKVVSIFFSIIMLALTSQLAAQTIDGQIGGPGDSYTLVGSNTVHTFGADRKGLHNLYYQFDPTNISIGIECNSGDNDLVVVCLDFDTVAGNNNGSNGVIPSTGGSTALDNFTGDILELSDLDLVLIFNSGDNFDATDGGGNDASCYLDWGDTRAATLAGNGGNATFQFVGTETVVDSMVDTSSTVGPDIGVDDPAASPSVDSITFAYSDANTSGAALNGQGMEISFPLSEIGASGATTVEFFAFLSGGGFVSGTAIPEIGAVSGPTGFGNIGGGHPLDWSLGQDSGAANTWTPGGTTGAFSVPVELSSFDVE